MADPGGRSDHKRRVLRLLDAVAERDESALRQLLAADVRWWAPRSAARLGVERPLDGVDAVVGLLGGGHSFFEPGTSTWHVHHLVEEDGVVAAHVRRTCRTTSGSDYDNEYHLLFRFADDVVAEGWEHVDTAYALGQILGDGAPPTGLTTR